MSLEPGSSRGQRWCRRECESVDGFSLIEVMVAMLLLLIVAIGTAPFFFKALQRTASQGTRQSAVTVGARRLEYVRGIDLSLLLKGRTQADVNALTAVGNRGLVDLGSDVLGALNADTTGAAATGTADDSVPTIATDTVNKVVFTTYTYIDTCYRSATDGSCTPAAANGTPIYRVSVDVTWPRSNDSCASARTNACEYVVTTLRDKNQDPVFNRNISAPSLSGYTTTYLGTTGSSMHPGQKVQLTLTGANFVSGARVTSNDAGDLFDAVGGNSGNGLNVPWSSSASAGGHLIRLTNPDGGTAAVTINVTRSTPTVTGLSPGTISQGRTNTFTVTGADFYAASNPNPVAPTVAAVVTAAGTSVPFSGSNVTVSATTRLTFDIAVPNYNYYGSASMQVTVTNPDGASASGTYTETVN